MDLQETWTHSHTPLERYIMSLTAYVSGMNWPMRKIDQQSRVSPTLKLMKTTNMALMGSHML